MQGSKVIAIHQPNLFPWLGFFSKIARADIFVFLDHVANNPRSAIYTKRVKIISNSQEFWVTLPLKSNKAEVFIPINSMEIDKPGLVATKHLKTIELNYKKAPFFSEVFEYIVNFYNHPSPFIAERNIDFIVNISKRLRIGKEFIKSSDLNCIANSTDLLIEIIQKLKGTDYLSGDGAADYQIEDLYRLNGIKLAFTRFEHPVYQQFNAKKFYKGLSIIDVLMNLGFEGTQNLLLSLRSVK